MLKLETLSNEKEIIEYAVNKQLIIDASALPILSRNEKWKNVIDQAFALNELIISQEFINKILSSQTETAEENISEKETEKIITQIEKTEEVAVKVEQKVDRITAKEYSANFKILDEFDITGKSCSEGKIENFIQYFQEKYNTLKELLEKKQRVAPKPLDKLDRVTKGREVDTIGMVQKKWISKKGHAAFILEDMEGEAICLILKDNKEMMKEFKGILLDDVIAIKGKKASENMIIVEEILWPDIPYRQPNPIKENIDMCLISDMHLGSRLFLENEFQRLIDWLNLKGLGEKQKEKAGRIKYLFICGDNVDGCGVYPEQYTELTIPDIYKQYDAVSKFLEQIPDYIEVFMIPGQHDAVRWAEPQPAIPKEFLPKLYEMKNMHLLGSPSMASVEGLNTLLYHGPGLIAYYVNLDNCKFAEPTSAMIEALKRRNLMPTYGVKQPVVPEQKDYLLIRKVPDIFLTGDVHSVGFKQYKGTILMNAGTWQKQTDYQIKQGHVPNPGISLQLSLSELKITENHFYKKEKREETAGAKA